MFLYLFATSFIVLFACDTSDAGKPKARARLFRTHARSKVHNTHPTTIREKRFFITLSNGHDTQHSIHPHRGYYRFVISSFNYGYIRSKEAEEMPSKTKPTPPLPRRAKNVTNPYTSLLCSEIRCTSTTRN